MRRIARFLLLLFAFVVPWQYSLDVGPPFGNIARLAGVALVAIAIPAVLRDGKMRRPGALQGLVLAMYVWLCVSIFWSIDQGVTLIHLRGNFQELATVWLIWEFADSAVDLRDLMRAYVAGCLLLGLLSIWDFASSSAGEVRFAAEGQDPNDVARYLDLAFPMAALLCIPERRWPARIAVLAYFPVGVLALALTASREGAIGGAAALAGCGVLLARRNRRLAVWGAASLPVVAGSMFMLIPRQTLERIASLPAQLVGSDLNQRAEIWAAGWQAFAHAPFFGYGAGTFVAAARLAPIDTAHNTALAIAVETGIVGLFLATAIFAVCSAYVRQMQGAVRIAMTTALLAWLICSLAATVQENRTTWLLLGLTALAGRLAAEEPAAMARLFGAQALAAFGENATAPAT